MKWYHYVACFCAGLFLTNTVPHFVHGVSGDFSPLHLHIHRQRVIVSNDKCSVGVANLVIDTSLEVGKLSQTNK